jgi:hypothetical protein
MYIQSICVNRDRTCRFYEDRFRPGLECLDRTASPVHLYATEKRVVTVLFEKTILTGNQYKISVQRILLHSRHSNVTRDKDVFCLTAVKHEPVT